MIGLRPRASELYLERPRLLRRLPDSPGYAVWLEAPYAYGKSVLATQWASTLEAEGWRVIWLAVMGEDPRGLLARALELPMEAPWSVVLETLWGAPTLVVLEELEGHERFSPLLRNLNGLVLLSSRRGLGEPEVPRLMAEGRLIHLGAAELAFTLTEAEALFGDTERARAAWAQSQGWSLPLHLSSLTGELPSLGALFEGVRESLEPAIWDEALLLAALSHLPLDQATPETGRLADAGFAQALETGYRLHPLAAETVLQQYPTEVQRVVRREAHRLPPLLRGEALERAGASEALDALLETDDSLAVFDPEAVLRWDALAPQPRGPRRLTQVGSALGALGRRTEGVRLLLEAARDREVIPEQALGAYREAVWFLCEDDLEQARAVSAEAEALLGRVSAEDLARFLNNRSRIDLQSGDLERAEATIERALALLPVGHARRFALMMNLATLRWYSRGDLEGCIAVKEELLPLGSASFPDHVGALQADLGRMKALLGRRTEAIEHFREAQRHTRTRPWVALEAEAWQALLENDLGPLPEVTARLERWENTEAADRVRGFWAMALVEGQPELALKLLEGAEGLVCSLARALALAHLGRSGEAAALPERPEPTDEREPALHWQAVHYRITRETASLKALLDLTLARARVLPGLVPLADLPRDRPELARAYPLEEVLRSGWKEAVALRSDEIPPLELEVLGGFRVRLLGQEISLSGRLREILLLSLLGESREAIGEAIWPELEREKLRNNLHVNLNLLRRTLEPWGLATYFAEGGLRHVRADLHALEFAIEHRDAEAILALYRGKLAPSVDLEVVNENRDQLHERVLDALFKAAREAPPARAEAYLERTLELDPLHEPALEHLLALLVAQGRRKSAEQRYRAFAHRLMDEMGLEPMPQTRRGLR